MDIKKLIEDYVAIRDKKAQIKAEQDQVMDRINRVLKKIENSLMEEMNAIGSESVRTDAGTCYKSIQTRASVADRDIFLAFVKANDAWNFLESRVKKEPVEEYLAANQELPPGVTVSRVATVNICRS